jgi:hypothetical protein
MWSDSSGMPRSNGTSQPMHCHGYMVEVDSDANKGKGPRN